MDTALKILIVALTVAAGGYLVLKPGRVYGMTSPGRVRGEGEAGAESESFHRQAALSSIRGGGVFILSVAAYVVYLWASR